MDKEQIPLSLRASRQCGKGDLLIRSWKNYCRPAKKKKAEFIAITSGKKGEEITLQTL